MSEMLIVCSRCGGVNRVPDTRSPMQAKCGYCGLKLFGNPPENVGGDVFDRQVGRSSIPVLVNVWAAWCGPCKAMAPAYAAAARELEPEMRLIKLDADAEQGIAGRLGVRGIPALLLFHRGRELARTSGAMSSHQIVRWVRDHLTVGAS